MPANGGRGKKVPSQNRRDGKKGQCWCQYSGGPRPDPGHCTIPVETKTTMKSHTGTRIERQRNAEKRRQKKHKQHAKTLNQNNQNNLCLDDEDTLTPEHAKIPPITDVKYP